LLERFIREDGVNLIGCCCGTDATPIAALDAMLRRLGKTTAVMRENLEEMTRQGAKIPVMLGSAALTRRDVEEDCAAAYGGGRVAHARDALDGLALMAKVVVGSFDAHLAEARVKAVGCPVNQKRKLGRAADPRPLRPADLVEIRLRRAALNQGYRGRGYSFGYPACPNVADQSQHPRTRAGFADPNY
jgi:cobalamin-dependent methionine synthase I